VKTLSGLLLRAGGSCAACGTYLLKVSSKFCASRKSIELLWDESPFRGLRSMLLAFVDVIIFLEASLEHLRCCHASLAKVTPTCDVPACASVSSLRYVQLGYLVLTHSFVLRNRYLARWSLALSLADALSSCHRSRSPLVDCFVALSLADALSSYWMLLLERILLR
jgi:hypothetical protein